MVDSWRVATGESGSEMEDGRDASQHQEDTMLARAEQVMNEFQLKTVELFDHTPVLRVQVRESEFARALELRATLVEKLRPIGYRFIALDLDTPSD